MTKRCPPLRDHWARVGKWRVFSRYRDDLAPPGATPLLLVHGLIVSGRYLVPLAERMAASRPVYVPDLPGHGRSDHPSRALDVPALADALVAWMDARGLERVTLLGNSFGCQIIANCAARYPNRVENLVLLGPTVAPSQRSPLKVAVQWSRNLPREPFSLVAIILGDFIRMGPWLAREEFHAMLADCPETVLPSVGEPALVIRGQYDTTATRAWCEQVARLLPRGGLVEIPDAVHVVNYSAPDATSTLIRARLPTCRPVDLRRAVS